jgi:hypothetical protein
VDFLRTRKGFTNTLAECRLIVTGSDVQVATSREKIMSALLRPGQTSFAFVFDLARTVNEMKREIESFEWKPPARASAPKPLASVHWGAPSKRSRSELDRAAHLLCWCGGS